MAKADWLKIKNEYINTNISQRKLAEKYKVSFSTLKARASREEWNNIKKKNCHKIATKLTQKTAEKIIEKEVDRLTNVLHLADKLSPKIEKAIEQLELTDVGGAPLDTGIVDTDKMRKIVASIKDLKDIVKDDDKNDISKLDKVLEKIGGVI